MVTFVFLRLPSLYNYCFYRGINKITGYCGILRGVLYWLYVCSLLDMLWLVELDNSVADDLV